MCVRACARQRGHSDKPQIGNGVDRSNMTWQGVIKPNRKVSSA